MTSGYLKNARIFGFNGVYKRLAVHLGLMDIHLGPGLNAEGLIDAWARDLGLGGLAGARHTIARWKMAVGRSLAEKPPRTKPGWSRNAWVELAHAFAPGACKVRERRFLQALLLPGDDRQLGALRTIWRLQSQFGGDSFREESLHDQLERQAPHYAQLLVAIRTYEAFARSLQDAFDVLRTEAARPDAQGFVIPEIARDADFRQSIKGVREKFQAVHHSLGESAGPGISLQNLFGARFEPFAESPNGEACAMALCSHHETVQRAKSADGERPWFDRIGQERIYIRHSYLRHMLVADGVLELVEEHTAKKACRYRYVGFTEQK